MDVCIRMNSGTGKKFGTSKTFEEERKENEDELFKKCPKLKGIQAKNILDAIVNEVFPVGFPKNAYLRYLRDPSGNSRDQCLFAIRPVRTEDDFTDRYLDEGQTFLFSGHRYQGKCIIDSIQIVQETERRSFESEQQFNRRCSVTDDTDFIDCLSSLEPQGAKAEKNLEEWRGYLHWRRKITEKQLYGVKYFSKTYNDSNKSIVFGLLFSSKQEFEDKKTRKIKREVYAFNNLISLDSWNFKYDKDLTYIKKSGDLGKFQRFFNEQKLDGKAKENPTKKRQHSFSRKENEETEKTSEKTFTENDLRAEFQSAYIVYAEYKLPDKFLQDGSADDSDDSDDSGEDVEEYVKSIPNNGFIALSAAGEFALIRRFESAISDLEGGKCYSQTLIDWIFDVKNAALPNPDSSSKEITHWANSLIAQNPNQRQAVEKALNAPELFLLQGPPGTGKTTVIAEIIYQFAMRGLRVLVSSQSNDAVDNALDCLSSNPAIRAIRLGGRGGKKKKKNVEEKQCKYVEKNALKCYYKSIADSISARYLGVWENAKEQMNQCQKDERDFSLAQRDLDGLRKEINEKKEISSGYERDYHEVSSQIEQEEEAEQNAENTRRQLERFREFLNQGKPYDVLPSELLSILESELSDVKLSASANGISVPDNFISAHSLFEKDIQSLLEKFQSISNTSDANSEIDNLNAKIELCRREMSDAFENGDYTKGGRKRNELNILKERRDKLNMSGGIEFSEKIRSAFSSDLQKLFRENRSQAFQQISAVSEKWDAAVESAKQKMDEFVKGMSKSDISELTQRKNILEGKIKVLREEIQDKRNQRDNKQNEIREMKTRYGLPESATDWEISDAINARLAELKAESDKSAPLRDIFADTMKKFTKKLTEQDTFDYDNDLFLEDYIRSCNVVGISCTSDMRKLSYKGFENFDVVIIDEVSKATPPELLIPLLKAGKVILVGDHRQLPPMFEEHERSYKEMIDELEDDESDLKEILTEENFTKYKKMVTASLFKEYFEQANEQIKHPLLTQYRMHSDIMNVINRFYEGKLESGLKPKEEEQKKAHNLTIPGIDGSSFIQPQKHVYWLDSSFWPSGKPGYETFRENSTSACNILEQHIIIELLKKIASAYKAQGRTKDNPVSVGIISFYQRQVNEIRAKVKELRKSNEYQELLESLDIDVNTVDRFQGKEKNIIITSLVRNNKKARASKHVVTYERINVAFSRAQNLLFIVGAEHMYGKLRITIPKMDAAGELTLPVYKNIISDLKRGACFAESSKLISPELEKSILSEMDKYNKENVNSDYSVPQEGRSLRTVPRSPSTQEHEKKAAMPSWSEKPKYKQSYHRENRNKALQREKSERRNKHRGYNDHSADDDE